MQFSTVIVALFAASAAALPAIDANQLAARQSPLCTGPGTTPLCCATDVLDLANLDCSTPPSLPSGAQDFIDICSAIGQQAKCCLLPILGQGLICNDIVAPAPAPAA
ncbi:hypothetical protein M501DRAFT_942254 [Patellaria atrata CBS 101060]|uniref:Hydrophobin n=1 Tax=Patellaria atrata CBS 101060 TaxID=1346257 RepID=A0A9P4VN33_9PEZI|nr:hypothetical protein M501DRAFT_942254 [Patellaria atrata CBS 101060]